MHLPDLPAVHLQQLCLLDLPAALAWLSRDKGRSLTPIYSGPYKNQNDLSPELQAESQLAVIQSRFLFRLGASPHRRVLDFPVARSGVLQPNHHRRDRGNHRFLHAGDHQYLDRNRLLDLPAAACGENMSQPRQVPQGRWSRHRRFLDLPGVLCRGPLPQR